MKTLLFALMLAVLPGTVLANPLENMLGKNRVLLLFDKSRSSATLDRQVDLLRERRPDMKERDLVVLVTAANKETAMAIGYANLPRGANRLLRQRFEPARQQTTMVLVGKDGTEKARWNKLVQPDEIFQLIDETPMRQEEIKESAATN